MGYSSYALRIVRTLHQLRYLCELLDFGDSYDAPTSSWRFSSCVLLIVLNFHARLSSCALLTRSSSCPHLIVLAHHTRSSSCELIILHEPHFARCLLCALLIRAINARFSCVFLMCAFHHALSSCALLILRPLYTRFSSCALFIHASHPRSSCAITMCASRARSTWCSLLIVRSPHRARFSSRVLLITHAPHRARFSFVSVRSSVRNLFIPFYFNYFSILPLLIVINICFYSMRKRHRGLWYRPAFVLDSCPSVCPNFIYTYLFQLFLYFTFINSKYHLLLALDLIILLLSCGLFIIRASYRAHSSSIALLMCASGIWRFLWCTHFIMALIIVRSSSCSHLIVLAQHTRS